MNKETLVQYFKKNFTLIYDVDNFDFNYGTSDKDSKLFIKYSLSNENFYEKRISVDKIAWKEWKGKKIPFLFDEDNSKKIMETDENGNVILNYDIVSATFYLLSGQDEYLNNKTDIWDRFQYENSLIKKLNIIDYPVVSYYFDICYTAFSKANYKIKRRKLWNNREFATFLTHDIDKCKSGWKEDSFAQIKKKKFFSAFGIILRKIFDKDTWFNFDKIIHIENNFNIKSTFFFLPKKNKYNADYSINEPKIKGIMTKLRKYGFEIGMHPSLGCSISENNFSKELEKFDIPINGVRFHYLSFDIKKTVSILENNNISYDSTLGFAEQIGFRRATCYPFYLYDFENKRISNVMEFPLIVMDTTLRKYMNLKPKDALNKIIPLIDEVASFGGVFTLLWHNSYFSEYKYKGWKSVYIDILKYCKSKNSMFFIGRNIYETIL
jgi:hypothetical protein